jgi:hypothetical protein
MFLFLFRAHQIVHPEWLLLAAWAIRRCLLPVATSAVAGCHHTVVMFGGQMRSGGRGPSHQRLSSNSEQQQQHQLYLMAELAESFSDHDWASTSVCKWNIWMELVSKKFVKGYMWKRRNS